jgi:hypothetical protein
MRISSIASVLTIALAALTLAGCRDATPMRLKGPSLAPAETCDCGQRHLDHNSGNPPCGAQTLDEKVEHDRRCAATYRDPGYAPAR